jgi:NAD(P)-dependent dehydrogenase (short-subunit alcohol dehydrogenase family)
MKGLRLLSLEGRRAVVTGGGTGLGRSIARGFVEAGAEAVIVGRREGPLEEARAYALEEGGVCEAVVADVTDEADVQRLAEAAGRVDILVNNAGIAPDDPWETVPLSSWQHVFAVNVFAPFRLCQAFAPAMRERGWGRIINVASVYGQIAGKPDLYPPDWGPSSYFSSKHSVHGLTRYLAVRLAPHGVTVNSLSPGGVSGATNRGLTAAEQAEAAAKRTPEQVEADERRAERFFRSEVPMRRGGDPDDYTGPAVFLASPASSYMTGQILVVDGGWTVW